MIEKFLEDLERRIDPRVEDTLWDEWLNFTDGKFSGDIFSPARPKKAPPNLPWPKVRVNQALGDFELMALQQLSGCSHVLETGSGAFMSVRSNYGTCILPSIFGAEIYYMPDESDTLPTNRPIPGGVNAMKDLIARGRPNNRTSLGAKTLQMAEVFADLLGKYPNVKKYVHHYHPDLQGPMDVCELVWGSGLFVDLYDYPDVAKALLDLLTQTYIQFLTEWSSIVPFAGDYTVHWSTLIRGRILLRDDSAMNLSPEMFDEFIKPYNQKLYETFGGGADHFCGRGDHFIQSNTSIPGLYAVNMSQPEYNDMETIYRHTVDQGINLLEFSRPWAEKALREGRPLHGRVHCG
jgi:hypothetical protein